MRLVRIAGATAAALALAAACSSYGSGTDAPACPSPCAEGGIAPPPPAPPPSDASAPPLDAGPDAAPLWIRTFPGSGATSATASIAVADGVVIVGTTTQPLDLGTGPIGIGGDNGAFVAKLDDAGKIVFARRVAITDESFVSRIAVDDAGDLYATLYVVNTGSGHLADFGSGQQSSTSGWFVAKLRGTDGTVVWAVPGPLVGAASVAAAGSVVAIGGGEYFVVDGGYETDYEVDTLDRATGSPSKTFAFSSPHPNGTSFDVAVAPSGEVSFAFAYQQDVTIPGFAPLTTAAQQSVIVRLDTNLSAKWVAPIAGATSGLVLASLSSGDLAVQGGYGAMIDVGGFSLTSKGGSADVFFSRFTASGQASWAKSFGSASVDTAAGLAASPAGDLTAFIGFDGTLDVGGGPTAGPEAGQQPPKLAPMLLELDPAGNYVHSTAFLPTASAGALARRADATFVAGSFTDATLFGAHETSAGLADLFVARLR